MPAIDGSRLIGDLRELAGFGRYRTGVHRPAFSDADLAARRWLVQRMADAGLDAAVDGIGNVIGRAAGDGPRLLVGSHSDTQPHGGWLDGAMGVVYGIELARAMRDDPACRGLGVDVASWQDEEGHYTSFLGSRSFAGLLAEDEIDRARHRDDGVPLREAIARAGLAGVPRARLDAARYRGYLEAHIEQGAVLESGRRRIGVVTAIVGIVVYRVTFAGDQNHAGTTPMRLRRDAGVALTAFCNEVHRELAELAGPATVWTIGRIVLTPNAPSVVPGRAELLLQIRDPSLAIMETLGAAAIRLAEAADRAGPCRVAIERASYTEPVAMDEPIAAAIEGAAARRAGRGWMRMPSGAGHDAQILARRMPAGMLFVPSIGGVSHHYTEDTAEDDIVLGCQVFADAAEAILRS
ncbi:MAG: hydantoinase/carbamoylase family amidase [Proteobacteria bacterium]|nr:hydantoinase/carbamoylase family amidase [Pseudomonadota bacterium]